MLNNQILVLGPIFIPFIGIALSLAFARDNLAQRWIGLLCCVLAWGCSLAVLGLNLAYGVPQVYHVGGWVAPYGIVLIADLLAALFGVMATTVVSAGALYALHCRDKCLKYPAFMPLFLAMAVGLNGTLYTGDIFTMFVFLELMVISSVVLVAISDNPLGLEAAIKYLLISAMGTLFLLLGIGALYATFGTLNLAHLGFLLNTDRHPLLTTEAAVVLTAAFLLKSAVFPFHFWQPDFHTTAPTPVHAVLSSVVVKVGVYGILRMMTLLFMPEAPIIQNLVLVLGVIGIFFGSLGALRTYDAKRLLAYSTFGQIGFILVAIGWGDPHQYPLALVAAVVYAVNHAFIKASLLMITGVISSRMPTKTAALSEIGGAGHRMVFVSGLYFVGGMALAGLPPFNGFISKLLIVQGGVLAGGWIALGLAIGASLLTVAYMTRTWQLIFQQAPSAELVLKPYGDNPLAPALLIGLCVLLGLYAAPLVELAQLAVTELGDPNHYINAVRAAGGF